MNKTTKNVLTIAIVGVAGFLLYNNTRKKSSFTGVPGKRVKSMVGFTGIPGKRVKSMAGFTGIPGSRKKNITDQVNVQSSSWLRNANGAPANFYQVKSTNW